MKSAFPRLFLLSSQNSEGIYSSERWNLHFRRNLFFLERDQLIRLKQMLTRFHFQGNTDDFYDMELELRREIFSEVYMPMVGTTNTDRRSHFRGHLEEFSYDEGGVIYLIWKEMKS